MYSSTLCFNTFCLCVCLSVGLFPRHGYSFKDRTVWSSPNDSKCLRLGVSVLKISNLPIPEVAFNKNVKISQFFATRLCALIFTMNAHSTQLQGLIFFGSFMHYESAREVDGSVIHTYCIVTLTYLQHFRTLHVHFHNA